MPNHITNVITVTGATIQDILNITVTSKDGEGSQFDFNAIIPMPESIKNTVYSPQLPEDEMLRQAENYKLYGYKTWYDFAIGEWGTKWYAYDIKVSDDEIRFDTAWAMPDPIFTKLSTMLPNATITVNFADEDIGYNCGIVVYKNGISDFTDKSDDGDNSKSFACELKYGNANEWKQWEED